MSDFKPKAGSRVRWREEKPLHTRMRYEGSAPMHFDSPPSDAYRANYDAIDWSDGPSSSGRTPVTCASPMGAQRDGDSSAGDLGSNPSGPIDGSSD